MFDPPAQVSMQMPRYKCHKEVWALKIARIEDKDINTSIIKKT